MRLSPQGLANIRRGLIRSWRDGIHRQKQQQRTPDADTLRNRAFYDRRGTLYADITKATEAGRTCFHLRWSTAGRRDQVDIFEDNRLCKTIRPSAALQWIDAHCA